LGCGPKEKRDHVSDFTQLLEAVIPKMRRYARSLTRDPVKADDLVQETVCRAIAKQHLFRPDTNLRAWLFTLMHNQYVNDVRRENRESATLHIDDVEATLIATTDPTSSRQLQELDQALGLLPTEQRQVILLVGLEGMSYEEVAMILNVPIGTVRSRLSRGRDQLRLLMGAEERRPGGQAKTAPASELIAA
jgi:RNA polymerase sigma-70 factor, ECF subfamily